KRVTLKSGATSKPLWTRSIVIGPPACSVSADATTAVPDTGNDRDGDTSCATAAAGATTPTKAARMNDLPLILRPQADVQRGRICAAHLDVGDVAAIARLLDFDRVPAFGDLHDQLILRLRSPPFFAVDEHVGVGGLNANGERAVARRISRPRRPWRLWRRWGQTAARCAG